MTDFTEEKIHPPPEPLVLANLPKSDLGNARRLMMHFGDDLRYVPKLGWRAWVGTHWACEDEGESAARRAAHDTADAISLEVEALRDKGKYVDEDPKDFDRRVAAHRKWAVDSGNAGRTKAMLAQAENYLRRERDQWDMDELTLNCRNGTLKFSKTEIGMDTILHPHNKSDYCTQLTGCDYDPEARAPVWAAHLEKCIPDIEKRAYFQRTVGYALTGSVEEQSFLIMQGGGSDGKSVSINAIAHALGGYAMQVDIKSFVSNTRSGADASPDIARMEGPARFVYLSEPEQGCKLDESSIKKMTGGDKIIARKLLGGIFEFFPVCKVFIPTNPLPVIKASDWGTWRRIKLMKWVVTILDHEQDKRLIYKLRGEASGILNWAIEGLADWLHDGLDEPTCITQAVKSYRGDSDPISDWLGERYEVGHGIGRVLNTVLYDDYLAWCEDESNRRDPMNRYLFGKILNNHQVTALRTGGSTWRTNISLKAGLYTKQPHANSDGGPPEDDGVDPTEMGDDPPIEAYGDSDG